MTKTNIIHTTSMGDDVIVRDESIIITFNGRRNIVSSSNLNGGYREDLVQVFNNSCGNNPLIKKKICPGMKGKTIEEHYAVIARELNLDPKVTTGMGTAALVENVAIVTKSYEQLHVTAIATAGIDVNGGSAGDLARHNEFTKQAINPDSGTINIFLLIDACLSPGVLTRACMTATEAKSVALRELGAPSMYSEEPATGSGTDSLIAIGNLDSDIELHGAGKHVLLGQLIGQSVKEAVKEALDRQCAMNPTRQTSVIWQGKRYGFGVNNLYGLYQNKYQTPCPEDLFTQTVHEVSHTPTIVAEVVTLFHLIDQHRWGIIAIDQVNPIAQRSINAIRVAHQLDTIDHPYDNYHQIINEIKEIIIQITNQLITKRL